MLIPCYTCLVIVEFQRLLKKMNYYLKPLVLFSIYNVNNAIIHQ